MRLPGWAERSPGGGKRAALEMAVIVRSEPIRVILASGWGGVVPCWTRQHAAAGLHRTAGNGERASPAPTLLPVLAGICQGEAVGQAR